VKGPASTASFVLIGIFLFFKYLPDIIKYYNDFIPSQRRLIRIKRAAEIVDAQLQLMQRATTHNLTLPENIPEQLSQQISFSLEILGSSETRKHLSRFQTSVMGLLGGVTPPLIDTALSAQQYLNLFSDGSGVGVAVGLSAKFIIPGIVGVVIANLNRRDAKSQAYFLGLVAATLFAIALLHFL
jgi:hypothetical protein